MSDLVCAFHAAVRDYSDSPALVCEEDCFTYLELADRVEHRVNLLRKSGLRAGDHLAILLPNSADYVVLMLAAAHLQIVLVPMNPALPVEALVQAMNRAKVNWIISDVTSWRAAIDAATRSGLCSDQCISITNPMLSSPLDSQPAAGTAIDDNDVVQGSKPAGHDVPYILTMTSGSTGDPKPILLGQGTKFERIQAAIRCYDLGPKDVVLVSTPLYHSLAERMVLLPLMIGACCVLLRHYSSQRWIDVVEQYCVTFSIVVSAQAMQIASALKTINTRVGSSLSRLVSSSSSISIETKALLMERLDADLHECYGTSEVAIATNLDCRADPDKLASVGRPLPGVAVAIIDAAGEFAEAGEPGEIVCKTPCQFLGYFEDAPGTAEAMQGCYVRTGDLGYMDEDGYLYFLDRIKDIVITGGINVFPSDVEAVIAQFSGVKECAAFALPSAQLGECVAVAVVTETADLDRRGLRAHCVKYLADYQQPQQYFQLAAMPRNALGKVSRRDLITCCLNKGDMLVS